MRIRVSERDHGRDELEQLQEEEWPPSPAGISRDYPLPAGQYPTEPTTAPRSRITRNRADRARVSTARRLASMLRQLSGLIWSANSRYASTLRTAIESKSLVCAETDHVSLSCNRIIRSAVAYRAACGATVAASLLQSCRPIYCSENDREERLSESEFVRGICPISFFSALCL